MAVRHAVLLASLLSSPPVTSVASAGTVTGVTVSPASVAAGTAVTVTVSGSNPCGAAHVNCCLLYTSDAADE